MPNPRNNRLVVPPRRALNTPLPDYYRVAKEQGVPTAEPASAAPRNLDPKLNGELWGLNNAANVGPLRTLYGRQLHRIIIPSEFTPAGVANVAVLLTRNDDTRPKFVRVRLQRPVAGAIEGRIFLSAEMQLGADHTEYVDLTTETGYRYDAMLRQGEKLWALGAWPGVVPVSIPVTVAEWSP